MKFCKIVLTLKTVENVNFFNLCWTGTFTGKYFAKDKSHFKMLLQFWLCKEDGDWHCI